MKEINQLIEDYREELIKSIQEIVRIPSLEKKGQPGKPFGEEVHAALEYALSLAETMGFAVKNLDGYAGYAEMGEGNETVGILGHLDVVPEGEGWSYPPYGAEIHDDKIFGRGTIDDKGPTIAALYAMKALKESKLPITKKIRIIFGTNEETGMKDMEYYLSKEKSPDMGFTPDGDFPVIYGEKGIQIFSLYQKFLNTSSNPIKVTSITGGSRPNVVPEQCTAILQVEDAYRPRLKAQLENFIHKHSCSILMKEEEGQVFLVSKGISAHGSTPEKGRNAISQLLVFLGGLEGCEDGIFSFLKVYTKQIGMEYNGESIGCGFQDEISGKLIFNVGVIRANENEADIKVNIRYPITYDGKDVLEAIRKSLEGTAIHLLLEEDSKPLYVPKNHKLIQGLMKIYKEETGDQEAEPITIGGGTYARTMENIVAFGPLFPGDEETAHQKDEYISIDHLMRITHIYAKALYELAK